MSNYAATIVKLEKVWKHSNADRLQCTHIFGNNVIVGLNAKEGDIGLFFPLESQIGAEFAVANDLIRRKDPTTGKAAGGMFDSNRRVRCQKFRGEESMGFWIPINSLLKTPGFEDITPSVGLEIEEHNGITLSKKYIPEHVRTRRASRSSGNRFQSASRLIPEQFHFHYDTAQLGKNIHNINPNTLISLTWKLHGTSAIASKVLVRDEYQGFKRLVSKIAEWFGVETVNSTYDTLYASRNVVKNGKEEQPAYEITGYDLWTDSAKQFDFKLHNGETVYYEIVGYDSKGGRPIQKMGGYSFDYGCNPGDYEIYVYRITHTNVDGIVHELAWPQVIERCGQLGLRHVPSIFYGYAADLFEIPLNNTKEWRDKFLSKIFEVYAGPQDSIFCNNPVPEEGVVLRIEGLNVKAFKAKSFRFLKGETEMLDTGEIDIETEQSEEEAA